MTVKSFTGTLRIKSTKYTAHLLPGVLWVQTIRTYLLHNRVLDVSWNSKFKGAFNTSFAHIKNGLLTLMQSYKRTPNIFYASTYSSKSKNQSGILSIFINKPSLCRGSKTPIFHFKTTYTSCTDEVPVKKPSFQKFTLFFYNFKHSVETLSVYISLV